MGRDVLSGLIWSRSQVPPKALHDWLVRIWGEWPGALHVDGWNAFKIPIWRVHAHPRRSQYHKSVRPCTARQGSLSPKGIICNAVESYQGKFMLIPRPSRAREIVTLRGAPLSTETWSWVPWWQASERHGSAGALDFGTCHLLYLCKITSRSFFSFCTRAHALSRATTRESERNNQYR